MIATITLNPAVDKTLRTSAFIPGAVNRADEVQNIAGGKGINVARVLANYGYPVKALGFLGGYCGDFIRKSVEQMGIKDEFTKISGQTRTSINVVSEDGYVTEFLEPGPMILPYELEAFTLSYKESIKECDKVIISGSLPQGVPVDYYAKLINIAKEEGKKVLLDSSGESLKKGMFARPYMMKPNMKELETLMCRRLRGMEEISEAAMQIVEWGVPNVVVSMGSKGILYAKEVHDDIKLYYVQAPNVKAVNTVGSGDCAVAAFAMADTEGLSDEDIVKKCVAISAANAVALENADISMDTVLEFENSLAVNVPPFK